MQILQFPNNSWGLTVLKKHFPQVYRFKRFENGLGKKFPDLKFFSLILAEKPLFFPDFSDWKKSSKFPLNSLISLIGGNPVRSFSEANGVSNSLFAWMIYYYRGMSCMHGINNWSRTKSYKCRDQHCPLKVVIRKKTSCWGWLRYITCRTRNVLQSGNKTHASNQIITRVSFVHGSFKIAQLTFRLYVCIH